MPAAKAEVKPEPTKTKGYVCNRFKSLSISIGGGKAIEFSRGLFRTDDPDIQKLIEGNGWYGSYIRPE